MKNKQKRKRPKLILFWIWTLDEIGPKPKKRFGMLEAGAIPEAAAKAWQARASRGDQARLINSIFDTKGGKLVLQEKFIVAKHYTMQKTITKKENTTEMEDGFGKLIFCKKYGLNDEELQQCIQSGEVVTWKSGGLRLYAARNVTLKNEAEKIRRRSWKPTPSRWIKMQVNHSQRSLIRLCQR